MVVYIIFGTNEKSQTLKTFSIPKNKYLKVNNKKLYIVNNEKFNNKTLKKHMLIYFLKIIEIAVQNINKTALEKPKIKLL